MRKRTGFRPAACELLEERVVPSHGRSGAGAQALAPALVSQHTLGRSTVGTLGDSYTDEYRFYPPYLSHARNWVEILADTRHVDFGAFSTRSRGEPRDQGFAFNWARYGATSANMIQNQLPGLTAQVEAGQIKYAWIFIGGNDFLYFLQGLQDGSISLAEAPSELKQIGTQLTANFTTAFETLLSASPSVRLVVATLPDVSTLPIVQQGAAGSPQWEAIVNDTSQTIAQYNAAIQALAANNSRVALVDLASQAAELAQVSSVVGSVPYGGASINLTTPGESYNDFFLGDGLHIGTVGQGIIADDFVKAIDSHFGATVAPLSARQIVEFARHVQAATQHGSGPP